MTSRWLYVDPLSNKNDYEERILYLEAECFSFLQLLFKTVRSIETTHAVLNILRLQL